MLWLRWLLNEWCDECLIENILYSQIIKKERKKMKISYAGFVVGIVCVVLTGCRTVTTDTQLDKYIESINTDEIRQRTTDNLVGSLETSQEYKSKYDVVFADENYISFRAEEFSRFNGLHGTNKVSVGTIDRKSGCRLCLADIVPANKIPQLTEMLRTQIIKKLGSKEHIRGDIKPTENFCVVKDGLKFVYNDFELVWYSVGEIEVVISFDVLEKRMD